MVNNLELIKSLLQFETSDDFYYLQILQRRKDGHINPNLACKKNSRTIKSYYIDSIDSLEEKMSEIIEICNLFNARAVIRLNKRSYKKVAYRNLQKVANNISNEQFDSFKNIYSKACGKVHNAGKNKTWILDIDDCDIENPEDQAYLNEIINCINSSQPLNNGYEIIPVNDFLKKFDGKFIDEYKPEDYLIIDKDNVVKEFEYECFPDGMFSNIINTKKTDKHSKYRAIIPSKSGVHLIVNPFNPIGFVLEYPDTRIHKDGPTNLYIP